ILDLLTPLRRQVPGRAAVDAVLLLVFRVPLDAIGRDPARALRHVGEEEFPDRQYLKRLVADDANVELAPFDVLLDDCRGPDALVEQYIEGRDRKSTRLNSSH